jgi:hypothetical protein
MVAKEYASFEKMRFAVGELLMEYNDQVEKDRVNPEVFFDELIGLGVVTGEIASHLTVEQVMALRDSPGIPKLLAEEIVKIFRSNFSEQPSKSRPASETGKGEGRSNRRDWMSYLLVAISLAVAAWFLFGGGAQAPSGKMPPSNVAAPALIQRDAGVHGCRCQCVCDGENTPTTVHE